MLTILALGLAGIILMLGFAVFKICKLIYVTKPEEGFKGNFYLMIAIILVVAMVIAWVGESGYMPSSY